MFVGGFGVKVSSDVTVIYKNVNIKKGYRCKWIICCKLDGGLNAVKVRNESVNVVNRMCPYHKNIIYVTPPCVGMEHVLASVWNLARNRLAWEGAILVPMTVPYIFR